MKIRMLASFVGTGFSVAAGEETEAFSASDAQRLIAAGYAVPIVENKVERAVPQTTAKETRKRK